MTAPDQERELEATLARLAIRAVPDDAPVPAPPWQTPRRTGDLRRFGRATPWLVAAVLLVLAGLGVGAGVAFDASAPDRGPVATEPPRPTATSTSSDGTLGEVPTAGATPSSGPSLDRDGNTAGPDEDADASTAVSSPPPDPASFRVGVGSFGPVTVGMTQVQALAALGLTDAAVGDGPNSCFRYLPLAGSTPPAVDSGLEDVAVVDTATDRVVLMTPPASARDDVGLGVGSTLAQVQAAHPGGTVVQSQGGYGYVLDGSGDTGTGYTFGLSQAAPGPTATVTGFTVGTRGYARGSELFCKSPN